MKKLKKAFSLLLVFSLLLSTMSISAFAAGAADTQAKEQIEYVGGTNYYKADGTAGTADNHEVALTKEIKATGIENEFDIQLKVNTTLTTSAEIPTTPNAAVVLTIDMSGTMETGKMNGTTRVEVAKAKAIEFVNAYAASAGTDTSAKRMLAIAQFNTYAKTLQTWVDVNTAAGKNAALATISGITVDMDEDDRCTNFESATLLTNNLFEFGTNGVSVANIPVSNRWAIILSDGAPTVGIKTSEKSSTSVTQLNNDNTNGGGTNVTDVDDVWTYMSELDDRANLFFVGVSEDMDKKFVDRDTGSSLWAGLTPSVTKSSETVGSWLQKLATATGGTYIPAADATNLSAAFTQIANAIRTQTNKYYSDAWTATDPIGGSYTTYVEFLGFYSDDSGYTKGKVAITKSPDGDTASYSSTDNKIDWDLTNSTATPKTSSGTTVYTYDIKYRVRLANEKAGFQQETAYVTNGETTFTWQPITQSGYGDDVTRNFPIPQVKGYLGEFSFVKQDEDSGTPIGNVKFTLTHSCNDCDVAISPKDAWSSETTGKVKFSKIPSGHTYTLSETSTPSGYTTNDKSSAITVAYGVVTESGDLVTGTSKNPVVKNEREKVKLTVEKIWSGTTGAGIQTKFDVYKGNGQGEKVGDKLETVRIDNGAGSVETANSYPKYDESGHLLEYIVEEQSNKDYALKGDVAITKDADGFGYKFTFTNILTGETDLAITKVWNAPEAVQKSVKVALYKDSETTEKTLVNTYTISGPSWSKTVEDLAVYDASGYLYTYSVAEVDDSGNEITSYTEDGHDIQVSVSGTTVTNSVVQKKTSVSGTKTWKNGETYSDEVVVGLYANDVLQGTQTTSGLSYAFTELDMYDDSGEVITYTVKEMNGDTALNSGDTFTVENDTYQVSYDGNNITNTRVGEVDIAVKKVWVDDDDAQGLRPNSITLNLMNGSIVADTVTLERERVVMKEAVADDPTTEDVDETAAEESELRWTEESLSHAFSNLPKYDTNGVEIAYTVVEAGTENGRLPTSSADSWYVVTDGNAANGYTVTNTLDGTKRDITVTKSWNDALSAENRTATATITLYADGVPYDSVEFPKADGSNSHTFEDLNVYDTTGKVIVYTAEETSVPAGYTSGKSGDFTFTNTINQEYLDISVTKVWDGCSASTITVNLLANDQEVAEIQLPLADAVTGEPVWTYTFEDQPKYAYDDATNAASIIRYTVTEDKGANYYTGKVTGNVTEGFVITNTFNPGSTSIEGTKTWISGGYSQEVEVGLYANNVLEETQTTSNLSYKFENLPVYSSSGNRISYSVKEMVSDGNGGWVDTGNSYTAENGKAYNVSYSGNNITNSVPQGSASIPVEKVWNGPVPQETEVTFTVKRTSNGVEDSAWSASITLPTAAGEWKDMDSLSDLPSVDANGYEYTYTVTEDGVDADGFISIEGITYKSTVDATGRVFTNTVQDPGDGSLTVNKVWAGEGVEAEAITVQLLADGVAIDGKVMELNAENNWTGTFANLSLYNASTHANIVYSVKEVGEVNGRVSLSNGSKHYSVAYDPSVPGTVTVTNTLADSDAYMYRINRYYTAKIDGTLVDEGTNHDEAWTVSYKDESLNINAGNWTNFNGRTYSFRSGNVDWYNVGEEFTRFTVDGNNVSFIVEKYGDGDNCYVVNLYYYREYTTPYDPPYTPPYTPPVIIIPDDPVPLTPPPVLPDPEEPTLEEIFDEEVPLAEAPATGDVSALWVALSALSGAGLFLNRKKREEEE